MQVAHWSKAMTQRVIRRPHTSSARRLGRALWLGAWLATGCASRKPSPDGELRAQVKSLVERQAALERKLALLEVRALAARSPDRRLPQVESPSPQGAGVPVIPRNLATIKLAPPSPRAPSLPTAIALKEPAPELVGEVEAEPAPVEAGSFNGAMDAIRTGDVEGGAARLIAFADKNPRDDRAPTALFTAGLGLLTSGDVANAALALVRVSDDYPAASEAPDATVRLAQCELRLKRADAARATYARVIMRYPQSPAAKVAQAELESIAAEPKPASPEGSH